jgi:hypothetical protein
MRWQSVECKEIADTKERTNAATALNQDKTDVRENGAGGSLMFDVDHPQLVETVIPIHINGVISRELDSVLKRRVG